MTQIVVDSVYRHNLYEYTTYGQSLGIPYPGGAKNVEPVTVKPPLDLPNLDRRHQQKRVMRIQLRESFAATASLARAALFALHF